MGGLSVSYLGLAAASDNAGPEQPHWLARHFAADSGVVYRIDETARIDAELRRFSNRLAATEFWRGGRKPDPVQAYSHAQRRCLQQALGLSGIFGLGDFFRIWAEAFHQARQDAATLQSLLAVFLEENVDMLTKLHHLSACGMEDASTGMAAVGAAIAVDACHFCTWLLRDWLPPHLAYFHHQPRLTGIG